MSEIGSFRSIVELWPSREELAAEVGAKPRAVSKWWQRNRIPPEWWPLLLDTSRAREAGLTADRMMTLVPPPSALSTVEARA